MNLLHRAGRWMAALAFAVPLAAGLTMPSSAAATNYPAPIDDFGRFDSFPETIGSYHRFEVTAFAPDMADFSIGYNSRPPDLDSTVTLYFYPHRYPTEQGQLASEERQVLAAHEGARVLARRRVTLTHGAASREATLVTFAYRQPRRFDRVKQDVSSQLLLVYRDKGIFMVRSTSPEAQGEAAEAAMLELARRVDWESIPGR